MWKYIRDAQALVQAFALGVTLYSIQIAHGGRPRVDWNIIYRFEEFLTTMHAADAAHPDSLANLRIDYQIKLVISDDNHIDAGERVRGSGVFLRRR